MRVLFLGKTRYSDHPTIRAFLSLGNTRGHLVTMVNKCDFSKIELANYDLVCMKSHYADPQVWAQIFSSGLRAVNGRQATYLTEMRGRLEVALRSFDIPIPPAALTKEEYKRLNYPIMRKPQNSSKHDLLVLSDAPAVLDYKHFYYQEIMPADVVYKAYCVGERYFLYAIKPTEDGLKLTSDRRRIETVPGKMAGTIRRLQAATGLEIFNVDFVPSGNEYLVIDVNPFPGFNGIVEAAEAWWNYLESLEL